MGKSITNMTTKSMVFFSFRLLFFWIVISVGFLWLGDELIRWNLSPINQYVQWYLPEFITSLQLESQEEGIFFVLTAQAEMDIYRHQIPIAPGSYEFLAQASLLHSLMPIALFFILLLSWPTKIKYFPLIACIGCLLAVAIFCLTTPLLLASHIENQLLTAAMNATGEPLAKPLLMHWTILMELGGTWLLSIVAAISTIFITKLLTNFIFLQMMHGHQFPPKL
jgi:hypothetical protein